jgi:hypothetical protein
MTITLVANFLVRRSSTQNWSNIEKNEILTFSVLLNSLLSMVCEKHSQEILPLKLTPNPFVSIT